MTVSRVKILKTTVPNSVWPAQAVRFSVFFFAYYGYFGAFSPYASLFFVSKGISVTQIGVLMASMQMMRIIGPNVWTWVADHTQRRVMILRIAACLSVLVYSLLWVSHSFPSILLVMVVFSGIISAQGPLSEALMLSEMRGDLTHYGRLRLWGSIGFIALVTSSGQLLDQYGIEWMPFIAGVMLIILLGVSFRVQDAPQYEGVHPTLSIKLVLKQKAVIAFFTSAFFMVAAHSALYVFYSLYLHQIGYSKAMIGGMWAISVVAEILFFYYQAFLFRKLGISLIMMTSFMAAVLRFLMIGLGGQWMWILVIAQILHAATFAAHQSASVMMMQRWFSGSLQARGQALWMSVAYGLGGSIGGIGLSMCWNTWRAQGVYLVAAAIALMGWGAMFFSCRWQKQTNDLH